MKTLTIITPTFNRADCLKKCWESLKSQTSKDFQWLIIDDGSTDNTKETVESFISSSSDMCIEYQYKVNGGKHTALNYSHPYIQGKYVAFLDSDDTFTDDAVEEILKAWEEFGQNSEVGQVIFLKGYSVNEPICYVRNEKTVVDTLKEERIGETGRDCCDTYRTELFTRYPFPEFEGEKFIGEGSAFLNIELNSKGVYINKVIYICEYRQDGLTKAGRAMRLKYAKGGRYNSLMYMNPKLSYKTRIKKAVLYVAYSEQAKERLFKDNPYKLLTMAAVIPGTALKLFWNHKYRNELKGEKDGK